MQRYWDDDDDDDDEAEGGELWEDYGAFVIRMLAPSSV